MDIVTMVFDKYSTISEAMETMKNKYKEFEILRVYRNDDYVMFKLKVR